MTEADYQHECSRAELLGLPKPDIGEFMSKQTRITSEESEEEILTDGVEEGVRKEEFQRIGGGLEELNAILSRTQKKLNRFKTLCGNFSNLLQIQIGARKEGNKKEVDPEGDACSAEDQEKGKEALAAVSGSPKVQVKGEGNVELDKLDLLISRAEKAELSLSSQSKQIKKFLN